jgi:hypothetical protein
MLLATTVFFAGGGGGGGIYTWVSLVETGGRGTGEVSTFSRGVGGLWH